MPATKRATTTRSRAKKAADADLALAIDHDDLPTLERPTITVSILGKRYALRAPKLMAYLQVAHAEEAGKGVALMTASCDFVLQAFVAHDRKTVEALLADPDSDWDIGVLMGVLQRLEKAFAPYYRELLAELRESRPAADSGDND